MRTEFRRAQKPAEFRSLEIFDRKAFQDYPDDWFSREDWEQLDSWWMLIDGRKIGCCAFDCRSGECLYVASTGIHPAFQRMGFGSLMKCWQIVYARQHGFKLVMTNTRKSNQAMIRLNRKFGFKVVRRVAGYYSNPTEAAVVMTLYV